MFCFFLFMSVYKNHDFFIDQTLKKLRKRFYQSGWSLVSWIAFIAFLAQRDHYGSFKL